MLSKCRHVDSISPEHPGNRGVKRIQLANHIAQVVLRSGSAIGQREVTRSERKALRVHLVEDVLIQPMRSG